MELEQQIEAFLAGSSFAVVGASANRDKYGNKVLRAYQQVGREVYPIHPAIESVEGLAVYRRLGDVPGQIDGVSIVTPPSVTERVVDEAIDLGIKHIWMQPGAESDGAVERARAAGISVIAGGACVLVALRFRESS